MHDDGHQSVECNTIIDDNNNKNSMSEINYRVNIGDLQVGQIKTKS